MRRIILFLLVAIASLHSANLDDLLASVQKDNALQQKIDKERERKFLSDLNKAKELLKATEVSLNAQKKKTQALKKSFEDQKELIIKLKSDLDKKSETLQGVFSIVKQNARDLSSLLKVSMTSAELGTRGVLLDELSAKDATPTSNQIEELWRLYLEEIIESGKVKNSSVFVINNDGQREKRDVTRVGLFTAFDKEGYLTYDESLDAFVKLSKQPSGSELELIYKYYTTDDGFVTFLIDPTKGVLFNMLKEKATIQDRVEQGGIIGYIILILGLMALLFALYKYLFFTKTLSRIKKQILSSEVSLDNPLGRILGSFEKHKHKDIQTIEGKMDAAVLKEIPELQNGLAMIKLVSAVAPLLGLLGTVTGMIETFQSITLFGTGDPKLMAGGISQALMTTVLGLVVAIPVLFIYSLLSSLSKEIIEVLTQQSSGLVAKRLEMTAVEINEYDKSTQ